MRKILFRGKIEHTMEEVKDRFEVIGNKWDNPELLKGEEE